MPSTIRDRIKELRRVKASSLLPHPLNWRTHPARQKALLSQLLSEIGYADALLARETTEGLQLLDGHLRADTTPNAVVPVLVVDLTEEEAERLLLTLDPLAALAETDQDKLGQLLGQVDATGELEKWLQERGEALTFAPPEEKEPALRSQTLIEIWCSHEDLAEFQETLDRWRKRKGVTVNIA